MIGSEGRLGKERMEGGFDQNTLYGCVKLLIKTV